jgi:hypothetical protein
MFLFQKAKINVPVCGVDFFDHTPCIFAAKRMACKIYRGKINKWIDR